MNSLRRVFRLVYTTHGMSNVRQPMTTIRFRFRTVNGSRNCVRQVYGSVILDRHIQNSQKCMKSISLIARIQHNRSHSQAVQTSRRHVNQFAGMANSSSQFATRRRVRHSGVMTNKTKSERHAIALDASGTKFFFNILIIINVKWRCTIQTDNDTHTHTHTQ